MQSLLFPEFSPSDLETTALSEWTDRWLAGFPALDAAGDHLADRSLALGKLMTPLGPMLAVTSKEGLVLLEFVDRDRLEAQLARATRVHDGPLVRCERLGTNAAPQAEMEGVRSQVAAYFAGELQDFDLRLAPIGTPFQKAVWAELCRVPFGSQASYGDIASAIGRPSASRAVGAANGRNPIAIIQPCHRIVGADGTLTGYAGGLWRKRRLLELEAQTSFTD